MNDVAVCLDDTLGLTCRSRGVNDPGQIIRRNNDTGVFRSGPAVQLIDIEETSPAFRQRVCKFAILTIGYQQWRFTVLQNVSQTGGRKRRIKRNVYFPRFENA